MSSWDSSRLFSKTAQAIIPLALVPASTASIGMNHSAGI